MTRTRTPLPTLSAEERRRALDKAAEVRHRRSEVRKKITAGDITIKEALESSDTLITHMRVSSFLRALPGVGVVKTREAMDEIGIAETRRVGGLGARQRRALIERFWILRRGAKNARRIRSKRVAITRVGEVVVRSRLEEVGDAGKNTALGETGHDLRPF